MEQRLQAQFPEHLIALPGAPRSPGARPATRPGLCRGDAARHQLGRRVLDGRGPGAGAAHACAGLGRARLWPLHAADTRRAHGRRLRPRAGAVAAGAGRAPLPAGGSLAGCAHGHALGGAGRCRARAATGADQPRWRLWRTRHGRAAGQVRQGRLAALQEKASKAWLPPSTSAWSRPPRPSPCANGCAGTRRACMPQATPRPWSCCAAATWGRRRGALPCRSRSGWESTTWSRRRPPARPGPQDWGAVRYACGSRPCLCRRTTCGCRTEAGHPADLMAYLPELR